MPNQFDKGKALLDSLNIEIKKSEALPNHHYINDDDLKLLIEYLMIGNEFKIHHTHEEFKNILDDINELEKRLLLDSGGRTHASKLRGFVFKLSDLITEWKSAHDRNKKRN